MNDVPNFLCISATQRYFSFIQKKLLETPLKTYIKDWQDSMKELEKSTKEMNAAIKGVVK